MIGNTLGHYRIESELAAGGMAVVYRARDTRLDRTVAIKFVGEHLLADEGARERLLREARLASALNHPHICTIYEVGEADGQPYIAMEYVEGRPLSSSVPGHGLPVETVLRYGTQIADALAHAHEREVVHRDLKTSNVVITPEGRAKVLDFGLALRRETAEVAEATRSKVSLAETGSISGTLAYMAPEALRGEAVDARSDIWALGVPLYEMAAGALPFQGRTGYELTAAILREPPAPPPARVPPGMRAIIHHCLTKEPGQRYQRASEVRAALEALQSATVVAAPVALPAVPRGRWVWAVAGGLLLLAAVLAAVVTGIIPLSFRTPVSEPRPATGGARLSVGGRPSSNSEANEYFEKGMLFFTKQYDLPRARQMLERALELDPHFAEARAWYGLAHYFSVDSGFSNDMSLLYRAEEELRRALAEDPRSGRVHSGLAYVYLSEGRKELALEEAEMALEINPNDLEAMSAATLYYASYGDYPAAETLADKILSQDPLFFLAHLNHGGFRLEQGDVAGSIRAFEKILEQDPQNDYAIRELGFAHMVAGNLVRARLTLERLRPADRQAFRGRLYWALLLALEGKRPEALKEMDSEVLKYAGAFCWWVTLTAAEVYAVLGEKEKALEWLDQAVRNGDERIEWFRRDPFLANIRNELRFKQILDSIAYRRAQRASTPPTQPTK